MSIYYESVHYLGSGGEMIMLRCHKAQRFWSWRALGGKWRGQVPDDGSGKFNVLLNAAHYFGKSGAAMNWDTSDKVRIIFK